ncbi:MAG: hypothetical protein QOH24_972 [Verrucomicrobiota bacterium]|jgi:hypothetical protein
MLRPPLPFWLLAAPILFGSSIAVGQTSQLDRSQILRIEPGAQIGAPTSANEALGYAAPSENDADLGVQAILKRQEQYRPFTFTLSTPFFYTTNVALTRNGEVGDGVFAPALTLAYQPRIAKTLYGEVIVVQQLFYYDRFTDFNFTSFDAIAGVVWYLPQYHNLALRLRYDFNRLTDDQFDEFFQNHSIIAIAEMPFQFGQAMQLNLGALANISVSSDPQFPRRNDFEVYAGYAVQLSRSFSVDAVGRFIVKDYYKGDRTDINEILALTANYRPRAWLTVSAIATFSWNQSNQSIFDYYVADLGGGVAVTCKF